MSNSANYYFFYILYQHAALTDITRNKNINILLINNYSFLFSPPQLNRDQIFRLPSKVLQKRALQNHRTF